MENLAEAEHVMETGSDNSSDEETENRPTETSLDEFVQGPSEKVVKAVLNTKDQTLNCSSDDDSQLCPICFEAWTNSGEHRLVCLKCGHLFGLSCIERWLRGREHKCPQCNVKATRKHIRVLFAKSLKMMDTSERDDALRQLANEREARRKAEMEAAQHRLKLQVTTAECKQLREENEQQRQQLQALRSTCDGSEPRSIETAGASSSPATLEKRFNLLRGVKLNEQGGCRIMGYCPAILTLCVGQPSPNPLFPGFGVRLISASDFRASQYVAVHSKQMKDLAFDSSQPASLMLSCAMDKTVKVTNLTSNATVQTYTTPSPLWSCCWDKSNQNVFYAGSSNGHVYQFDMRNTSECVQTLNTEGSRSPVVSLEFIPSQGHDGLSGLIVGQLDQCSFYEKTADEFKLHLLPFEGNIICVSVEEDSNHLLVTCRPSARHPRVRHLMCQLTRLPQSDEGSSQAQGSTPCVSSVVHVLEGGGTQKVLTRNRLLPYPGNHSGLIVAASDEASQSVLLWDASSANLCQKVVVGQPVMDICAVPNSDNAYRLVALTDKQLHVFDYQ